MVPETLNPISVAGVLTHVSAPMAARLVLGALPERILLVAIVSCLSGHDGETGAPGAALQMAVGCVLIYVLEV